MPNDTIEYDGVTYYETGPGYYVSHAIYKDDDDDREHALHRAVWVDHHGEIPEGYHVHHVDGDPSNNDIENLECLSPAEHLRDRHGFPVDEAHENAREGHARYFADEENVEAHRQHWERTLGELYAEIAVEKTCDQCGEAMVDGSTTQTRRFCSGACKQRYHREMGHDDIERECPVCGETFVTRKTSPSKTCGRSCGQKLRWQD